MDYRRDYYVRSVLCKNRVHGALKNHCCGRRTWLPSSKRGIHVHVVLYYCMQHNAGFCGGGFLCLRMRFNCAIALCVDCAGLLNACHSSLARLQRVRNARACVGAMGECCHIIVNVEQTNERTNERGLLHSDVLWPSSAKTPLSESGGLDLTCVLLWNCVRFSLDVVVVVVLSRVKMMWVF